MIGADLRAVLPADHREALFGASQLLTDRLFDDLVTLGRGWSPGHTIVAGYLPRKYLPRYTSTFARQFLVCLVMVTWKLRAPDNHPLACVAEELALHAIIERAEEILAAEGKKADFGRLYDRAFEDLDFQRLFDPALDGIEESEVGRYLGMGNLRFEDWFKPFRENEPVHPYAEGDGK